MKCLLILITGLLVGSEVFAHSGGTDSSGGHNCSSQSVYRGLCTGYHQHSNLTPMQREQLRLGDQAAQIMSNGITSMRGTNQVTAQLARILNEHPDAAEVFQSTGFKRWISQDTSRQAMWAKASNKKKPDPGNIEALLVTYKGWPALTSPAMAAYVDSHPEVRTLFQRANAGGSNEDIKELVRIAERAVRNAAVK